MNYCVLCDKPGIDSIFNHRVCEDHENAYTPVYDLITEKYESEMKQLVRDMEKSKVYQEIKLDALYNEISILKNDLQRAVYSLDYACNHPFRNLILWLKKLKKGQGRVPEGLPDTHAEKYGQADGQ